MKKFKKIITATGVCASLFVTSFGGMNISANAEVLSKDSDLVKDAEAKRSGGYISTPWKHTPEYKATAGNARIAALPSAYMNDIDDAVAKYPATRDQGEFGTCWAHTALAMGEIDMIKDGSATKDVDYSELALAYFTYHSVTDPKEGTQGDNNYAVPTGNENYLTMGGNLFFAARTLNQWIGATGESVVPYSEANDVLTRGVSQDYAYNYNEAHLENEYEFNIRTNPEEVKNAILTYGAAGISYFASEKSPDYKIVSYNGDTVFTYYCPYTGPDYAADHAVTVVGWDDDFSRNNFKKLPPADGAWLIRNSWTTETGKDFCSYFWLSYYDKSIEETAYAFDFSKVDEYDNNYQYDGGGVAYESGYNTTANVFKSSTDSVYGETLKAVNISVTSANNVRYTVQVYVDLENPADPYSGSLVSTQTGTKTYAGTETIKLDDPVDLNPGTTFAVVVTMAGGYIDREYSYRSDWYNSSVSSKSGQSFMYSGSKWTDLYGTGKGNICIKALTSNNLSSEVSIPDSVNVSVVRAENTGNATWNSVVADGYEIDYAKVSGSGSKELTWSNAFTGQGNECNVIGLDKGKKYKFRIRSYNQGATTKKYSNYTYFTSDALVKGAEGDDVGSIGGFKATNTSSGVQLSWNKVAGADGYYVYRKTGSNDFKLLVNITNNGVIKYYDTSAPNGKTCTYVVKAYCDEEVIAKTSEKKLIFLKTIGIRSMSKGYKKLTVNWSKNSNASGYQLKYSTSSSMSGAKTIKISGGGKSSKTIGSLSGNKTYYFKIRCYKSGYYSAWSGKKKVRL